MPRFAPRAILALAFLALAALPDRLAAQAPSPAAAAALLRLSPLPADTVLRPVSSGNLAALPDTAGGERKDHTVTGLLIGAGLGVVAGWAFYDVMCEAVDNHCSDSRVPYLVVSAGALGALGALVGSGTE